MPPSAAFCAHDLSAAGTEAAALPAFIPAGDDAAAGWAEATAAVANMPKPRASERIERRLFWRGGMRCSCEVDAAGRQTMCRSRARKERARRRRPTQLSESSSSDWRVSAMRPAMIAPTTARPMRGADRVVLGVRGGGVDLRPDLVDQRRRLVADLLPRVGGGFRDAVGALLGAFFALSRAAATRLTCALSRAAARRSFCVLPNASETRFCAASSASAAMLLGAVGEVEGGVADRRHRGAAGRCRLLRRRARGPSGRPGRSIPSCAAPAAAAMSSALVGSSRTCRSGRQRSAAGSARRPRRPARAASARRSSSRCRRRRSRRSGWRWRKWWPWRSRGGWSGEVSLEWATLFQRAGRGVWEKPAAVGKTAPTARRRL